MTLEETVELLANKTAERFAELIQGYMSDSIGVVSEELRTVSARNVSLAELIADLKKEISTQQRVALANQSILKLLNDTLAKVRTENEALKTELAKCKAAT